MNDRDIASTGFLNLRNPVAAAAFATLIALATSSSTSLAATTYYWDPSGTKAGTGSDGTGPWNTSALNWYPGSGGADVAWPNTTAYDASFGAGGSTASTVTLGTAITAGGVIFNAGPSYTLTGSTLSLGADGITLATASAAQTINSNIALISSQSWTNSTAGALTVGGVISGGFGLTVSGVGNLTLSGKSTYSGGTTINAGTVTANYAGAFNDGSAFSFGSGDITVNSGGTIVSKQNFSVSGGNATTRTINLNGGTWTIASTIGSGAEYFKTLNFTGGTLTNNKDFVRVANGGSTISSNTSAATSTITSGIDLTLGNLTFNVAQGTTSSGKDLAITGGISENNGAGSGARSITKNGTGTLATGTVASSYTGGTTLAAGTILVGATNGLGTGTITAADTTTLASANTSGQYVLPNAIAVTGTLNIKDGFTLTGAISGNAATLNFNGTASTALGVTGDLSGFSGSINYVDTLNGNNLNFTGSTAASQDASAVAFNLSGAGTNRQIQLGTGSSSTFKMGSLAGPGGIVGTSGATAVTLQVGALNTNTTFSGVLSNTPFSGAVTGSSLALTKVGTGSLTLTSTNTYAAGTVVNGGVLIGAAPTNFGGSGKGSFGAGAITVNTGATVRNGGDRSVGGDHLANARTITLNGGTWDLNVYNDYASTLNLTAGTLTNTTSNGFYRTPDSGATINSLAAATSSTINTPITLTYASATFNVDDGAAANDLVVNGAIRLSDVNAAATYGITKSGTGTLVLNGASTYIGGTTISAGTLLAANTTAGQSSTGTGGVALNAGTLSSLGGGAMSYIAGTVTAGNAAHAITAGGGTTTVGSTAANIGTLAVGALSLNGNSTLYFDIASAASHDQINDSGALGATGTVNIVVPTTLRMSFAQVIKLIGFGSNTSTLSNYVLNGGTTPTGYSLSFDNTLKELDLNITAVPEPAIAATIAVGAFGLLSGRRRRSR